MASQRMCNVCKQRVESKDDRFIEHQNKSGRPCYGSFTPSKEFNPFKFKRPMLYGDEGDIEDYIPPANPVAIDPILASLNQKQKLQPLWDIDTLEGAV